MNLKKPAIAGTLESSDVQITLSPNAGNGIAIELTSDVMTMFGDAIEETIRRTLSEFDVQDARVSVQDKGALDFVIQSRMQCAICRSAEVKYDWGKDDENARS